MKAVILAGGFGTRLSEETKVKPKPMVEVGGKPILWHIMKIFSAYGITEFIIALGYKGEYIKEYFYHYSAINNDITVDLRTGETTVHDGENPNWKIHLIDTGLYTQTGGRLKRLEHWFKKNESFYFTYGDGVADIDLDALYKFHKSHGRLATVTTVRSPARFGRITFENDVVTEFYEKSNQAAGWINGGYFVLKKEVIAYVEGDDTIWERDPIERLVSDGELMGYKHAGFWSCMDTIKEKNILENLWQSGRAPWVIQ